jgi:hypothetical protein
MDDISNASENDRLELVEKIDEEIRPMAYLRNAGNIMKYMRPLAYASEVGESFRRVTSPAFVYSTYGLSFAYVIGDTVLKTYAVKHHGQEKMWIKCLDTAVWHFSASIALSGLTVHSIVKYSDKFVKKMYGDVVKTSKVRFVPVMLGLSSIPFIIHPIDNFTDWWMDNSIRKLYDDKLIRDIHHHDEKLQ